MVAPVRVAARVSSGPIQGERIDPLLELPDHPIDRPEVVCLHDAVGGYPHLGHDGVLASTGGR